MKTRRLFAAVLTLTIGLSLLGCAGQPLPEGFDAEEVTARAEEIVGYANDGDYDTIMSCLREDLQSAVTAEELDSGWAPTYESVGAFESIKSVKLLGTADSSTKEEYAVALVTCTHEKGSVLYTLSFDADLNLVGLYLK
ncbi:MAG TPA: DUF3887 domain-containing protein [Feifaniaceae bacterium]|nr:DUF3887 domain-containing protein [Feifaniaceae bacterium]